jgi:hypothetical protein
VSIERVLEFDYQFIVTCDACVKEFEVFSTMKEAFESGWQEINTEDGKARHYCQDCQKKIGGCTDESIPGTTS